MNTIKVLAAGLTFAAVVTGGGSAAAREKPARIVPANKFIQTFSRTPAQLRGLGIEEAPSITTTIHFEYNSTAIADEASRQQLAAGDLVAFVDQHLGQASGDLAGDLHLGGLEAPVAHAQAFGQAVVKGLPVAQPACRQPDSGGDGGGADCASFSSSR